MIKRLLILLFFIHVAPITIHQLLLEILTINQKQKIFLIEADSNNQPIIVDSTNAIDGSLTLKERCLYLT